MTETTDRDREATCPRCGYDLRGTIATWREQCPREGRCTECGLKFEWAELLSPIRMMPRWNVEFAARGKILASIATTLGMLLVPWLFWRKLRMYHEPQWKRFVPYFAALILVSYFLFAACQALFAWYEAESIRNRGGVVGAPLPALTQPASDTISPVYAAWWALMFPLSDTSAGDVADWSGRLQPVPSPREAFQNAMERGRYYRTARYDWAYSPSAMFAMAGAFWALLLAFMASAFVLLPQTMQRAKVRGIHVVRILLYSPTLLFIALWVYFLFTTFGVNPIRYVVALLVVFPLAVVIYWGSACSQYLRIPQPWFVAAVLGLMSALAAYVVLHIFFHDLTAHLLLAVSHIG